MSLQTFTPSLAIGLFTALLFSTPAHAAARVGAKAPDFTAADTEGNQHKLADYQGKYVVLEWFNHGCPFVQKHYESGNMPTLQKKWRGKNVVWLSINSSAKGKQGYEEAEQANKTAKEKGAAASAILLDSAGTIGKLYGATATPHMFVIDPKGKIVYAGAIDSIASTEKADIGKATNYVDAALAAATSGKPVKVKESQAYGCGVKYE